MKNLENKLQEIIQSCPWFPVLKSIQQLDLPDWWVAGGAIRNTVWKSLYGDNCSLGIKDIDVVFFDKGTDKDFELKCKASLQQIHPEWVFDVKNQASFGVWRPWPFVFNFSGDGIAHFLHTATANGVRLLPDNQLEIWSPYGLADLFNGIIRSTPFRHGDEAVKSKEQEFLSKCPLLKLAHDKNRQD